jgi:hypothetical protein
MIERPPQEKQWRSWLYVAAWTLIIYATIPLARAIQQFVSRQWDRNLFMVVVLAITAAGLAAAVRYVRKHQPSARSNYFWLVLIAGIFGGYTIKLGQHSPEEAMHFVQYGVLGILVYRAWTHRLQDTSVYLAAAITCGVIGTVDEFVQWLTPRRYWGLKDIWLNFFSAGLVQIAIAKGLQPAVIDRRPGRANLRVVCRLAVAALAILGASLLTTPPRIGWLADRVGWLEFLKHHDSVLLEYGYLYEDPDIGVFRSRFAPGELEQIDRKRAVAAASILNRFRGESTYPTFLKRYTPMSDPFIHEARVHLFRRDRHFSQALKSKNDPVKYARHLTIAWRENRIMEIYFPNTLQRSDYVWSEKKSRLAHRHLLPGELDDSWVSRDLVTRVSERLVVCVYIVLILGLLLLHWYFGKTSGAENYPRPQPGRAGIED